MDRKLWIVFLIVSFWIGFAFPTFVLARHEKLMSPLFRKTTKIQRSTSSIPSPKPTIKPTILPSPTISTTVTPQVTPVPTKAPDPVDSKKSFIMKAINEYRRQNGLSDAHTDIHTCSFAKTRASEIAQNFNHNGFRERINSKSLPYDSYSEVTENIAMNSEYTKVVAGWIASSGHAENMRADTPFVCVEYFGNFYVYEGWRP